MTNPTPIEMLLMKLEEARAQATRGNWRACGIDKFNAVYYADHTIAVFGGPNRVIFSSEPVGNPEGTGNCDFVCGVANATPALLEAFREVLGALNHISQYDAPAKGGEYTKVWMRLGKKATEALARANEIASQALGETKL